MSCTPCAHRYHRGSSPATRHVDSYPCAICRFGVPGNFVALDMPVSEIATKDDLLPTIIQTIKDSGMVVARRSTGTPLSLRLLCKDRRPAVPSVELPNGPTTSAYTVHTCAPALGKW
eukprot:GHVU01100447.1.p1 GENE.GHVU01100447.1~~GHVU01100447.1.p1  ORF type:complete len:117 (+),score=1.50 GHVU01100447.1:2576-2926(+)